MNFEPVKKIKHLFGFLSKHCDLGILAVDLLISDISNETVVALHSAQHVFRRYPRE